MNDLVNSSDHSASQDSVSSFSLLKLIKASCRLKEKREKERLQCWEYFHAFYLILWKVIILIRNDVMVNFYTSSLLHIYKRNKKYFSYEDDLREVHLKLAPEIPAPSLLLTNSVQSLKTPRQV